MYIVQSITANPLQQMILVLSDGTSFNMTISYNTQQQGWFITNLTYGSFVLNGLRVTTNPNILNQFRNQIPFGLAVYSSTNQDPQLLPDFSSGNCTMYILSQEEVNQYAELLSQGPANGST